jgi:CspA family cold shock protein
MPEKGYGFLQRDTGGSDVFVHLRELTDGTMSLEEGQTVEFNIISNEKGEVAQNVTVLNGN